MKQLAIASDLHYCTVANTQKTKLSLKITLPFNINNVTYQATFYLLQHTVQPIILGMDFLSQHLAHINLEANTITLSNNLLHTNSNKQTRLSLLQALTHASDQSNSSNINVLQAESMTNKYEISDRTQRVHRVQTREEIEENVNLLDVSNSDLNSTQKHQIKQLFTKYGQVMSSKPSQLGCLKDYKFDIDLPPNTKIIRSTPYRVDYRDRQALKTELDKMLEAGVIYKSLSSWSHPIFLVAKKDSEEKRCVVNMKSLNKLIDIPAYPTPNAEDLMVTLGMQKPTIFTKIDIRSAYFQLMLTKKASEICSFSTTFGTYSYAVAPMGINAIPSVFQNIMAELIGDMDNVFCYVDDILIWSNNMEIHLKTLEEILNRFKSAGLTISPSKTQIAVKEIDFLGFLISKSGIKANQHNLDKVIKLEPPTHTKGLKKALGLFSFLRKYVKNFSKISSILYDKSKSDKNVKLQWTPEMTTAFHTLKQSIKNAPLLGFIDLKSPHKVTLCTDASQDAIAYVLSQMQPNPITHKLEKRYLFFGGLTLHPAARKWPIWKAELYAVLMATKRLEQYLKPQKFILEVDNMAVFYLLSKDIKNKSVITRWLLHIKSFDFEVKHVNGISDNVYLADRISRSDNIAHDTAQGNPDLRIDHDLNVTAIKIPPIAQNLAQKFELNEFTTDKLIKAQDENIFYSAMKKYLVHHELPDNYTLRKKIKALHNEFIMSGNLLYHIFFWKGKQFYQQLCIPPTYIHTVMSNMHDNVLMGAHYGLAKTIQKIKESYYWPKQIRDISNYVLSCETCGKSTYNNRPKIPGVSRAVSSSPFSVITIDVLKIPTKAQGYVAVLSLICDFSKFLICRPIKNLLASTVANIIFEEIILKYSFMKHLVWLTDGGAENMGKITKLLFQLTGCEHRITTPQNPTGNSCVERSHSTILTLLRRLTHEEPNLWPKLLPYAVLAYNSTKNETTGFAPLSLLCNIPITHPLAHKIKPPELDICKTEKSARKHWLDKLNDMRRIAKLTSIQSKIKQKAKFDKHTRPHKFKIGNTVLVERPFYLPGQDKKLLSRFNKKYKIIGFQGPNQCNVKLRDFHGNVKPRSVSINKIKLLQERRLFPRLQRNIRQQASIKDKTVHDNVPPKQTPLTDKT